MRFTLISDGSSDRALVPIIAWAIWESGVRADIEVNWADFRGLHNKPITLPQKVRKALELYPCDVLFLHRDSEGQNPSERLTEVDGAMSDLETSPPHVPVIPVRMLEAWLLLDESAIRYAASNPKGQVALTMPHANQVEGLADPKEMVFNLLRVASEKTGRKLSSFHVQSARTIISQYIADFSKLRSLPSFQSFEQALRVVVRNNHLDQWK